MFGERWFQNGAEAGTSETAREPSERRNVRYLQTHKFVGITRRMEGDKRSCALRPWRAQVNHAGKAYRAPGSFSTAEDAARAYDELVRTLGLTGSKRVNFRRTTASARTCDPTEEGGRGEREEGRGGSHRRTLGDVHRRQRRIARARARARARGRGDGDGGEVNHCCCSRRETRARSIRGGCG